MQPSLVGLTVQTVGTALLAAILLYLSRGKGSRVLQAAAVGWLFQLASLGFLLLMAIYGWDYRLEVHQYWSFLYIVALCVAAIRMDHDVSLAKPIAVAAVGGVPLSLLMGYLVPREITFHAVHMGLLGVGWLLAAVFIFQSPRAGIGRQCAGAMALLSAVTDLVYVLMLATGTGRAAPSRLAPWPLAYAGFLDVLLEMLFGIGLIIWAMEDTERRLATLHARTADDSRRSQRRAWLDPLTETHNRFFLDEIRPELETDDAGGSIVLIDIDGLKRINDEEGHEEGDKAIWTVATGIKKLVRGNDHVIRWGGDEFLVILPGMDEELARRRFYMLPAKIDEVKQSPKPGGRPYSKFLAASVGIHPYSKRMTLDVAIAQADRVMYERKRAHREMRGAARGRTP